MFFFSDPFIYISQNVLYVSDLFTYIMIVKYMTNKSLNHACDLALKDILRVWLDLHKTSHADIKAQTFFYLNNYLSILE